MNSLREDFDDIMELFIGINYDLEKMRAAGHIEITDNLVILRDMLGKFQSKLDGGKKQKPKPLPKTPAKKPAAAKKAPARKLSNSDSESGSS